MTPVNRDSEETFSDEELRAQVNYYAQGPLETLDELERLREYRKQAMQALNRNAEELTQLRVLANAVKDYVDHVQNCERFDRVLAALDELFEKGRQQNSNRG